MQEPQPSNRISCNSYFSSKHVIGPPIEEKYNVISGIHLNNSWCYTFLYVGNCAINKSKYKAVHLNNDSVLWVTRLAFIRSKSTMETPER